MSDERWTGGRFRQKRGDFTVGKDIRLTINELLFDRSRFIAHASVMEDMTHAARVAGNAAFALAGTRLAMIGDQHDDCRVRAAEGLRMINSCVSCLDGPEQHCEHDREQAANQTNSLRVADGGRRT